MIKSIFILFVEKGCWIPAVFGIAMTVKNVEKQLNGTAISVMSVHLGIRCLAKTVGPNLRICRLNRNGLHDSVGRSGHNGLIDKAVDLTALPHPEQ